jgi:hypothetical protein
MTTNSGPSVTQTVNTQANMEPAGPNFLGGQVYPPALPSGSTDNWTVRSGTRWRGADK